MRTLICLLTLAGLLWASQTVSPLMAQEPKVRSALSSKAPFYAGQKLTLVVELLAPGYFASAPTFDIQDPQGLLIMPPLGSPVVSTETLNDVAYTVQRHELSVLAPQAGDHVVPPLTVRFQYKRAPLDKDSVPASLQTPEVKFQTTLPPGTEGIGQLISARELTVTEEWKPAPGAKPSKAGDAFTRTITYTARDMPGMMFPPFPADKIEGIAIYPKEPEVMDHSERGDLLGKRVDTLTYLLQQPGQYTLPGAKFSWWDLDASALRTIELPAQVIQVAPNPALAPATQAPEAQAPSPWSKSAAAAVAVVLALALLLAASSRLRHAVVAWMRLFRPVRLAPLNPTDH